VAEPAGVEPEAVPLGAAERPMVELPAEARAPAVALLECPVELVAALAADPVVVGFDLAGFGPAGFGLAAFDPAPKPARPPRTAQGRFPK